MKFVVVDMQGFTIPEFFPKELVFYNGHQLAYFLIKSPIPFASIDDLDIKRQIQFIQGNIHHINYRSGNVDYEDIPEIIKTLIVDENVDVVYVKGAAKHKFLEDLLQPYNIQVVNTEWTDGCPKLEKVVPECMSHTLLCNGKKTKCSVNNCKVLYSWLSSLLP